MSIKLGIGVITYNRKDVLKKTISHILRYTKTAFDFIIADDGSSDGTIDMLRADNIPYITGQNRGISWNRNRVLWYLKEERGCDCIIILEDDCFPNIYGWDVPWVEAIERYGHINFMPEITIEIDNDISSGQGTAEDPYIAPLHQAFCVGYHAKALAYVGYLDTRFEKYGEEHVEHTQRFLRAGYGGLSQHLSPERGQLFYLRGGLETTPSDSHGSHELAMRNREIHDSIRHEPLFRHPWRSDKDMFDFREEIATAFSRPPHNISTDPQVFDSIISLGGDELVNKAIAKYFGLPGPGLFDQFLIPFHTLISFFQNSFAGLLSTACLYGYHNALRCRDTLTIYHNCFDKTEHEAASVEMFHAQYPALRHRFHTMIQEMDTLCHKSQRVLFIRSWRDSYLYEGQHRPDHAATPNFQDLIDALASRYPETDFQILFVNFGNATIYNQRASFANIKEPDVCSVEEQLRGWCSLFSELNIHLRT